MNFLWITGLLVLGLGFLSWGADCFLQASVGLSRFLGIRPFVIGVVVVGFGTSAPELAVSLTAAFSGSSQIVVGNIVGSNIANIALILALGAILCPLPVHNRLARFELPAMIAASILLWIQSLKGIITRGDGVILLIAFLGVVGWLIRQEKRESGPTRREMKGFLDRGQALKRGGILVLLLLLGLGAMVGGSELLVKGAISLARFFGVSEVIIGLTIVAVGTSLPELASTIAGVRRNESDLVLGNIIGSNLFNILMILGTTSLLLPLRIPVSLARFEIPLMCILAMALLPFVKINGQVGRFVGVVLLLGFVGFLGIQMGGGW